MVMYGGTPDEDRVGLGGKTLVFWRAIQGRPVEVFGRLILPKAEQTAVNYLTKNLDRYQREYDTITRYIPEVTDLKIETNDETKSRAIRDAAFRRLLSYDFYCALVNHKTKTVNTIHYGVYSNVFYELFDGSREPDVRQALLERMNLYI